MRRILFLLVTAVAVSLVNSWPQSNDFEGESSDGVVVTSSDGPQEEAALQASLKKYQDSLRPSKGRPRSIRPPSEEQAPVAEGEGSSSQGRKGFGGRGNRGWGAGGRGWGAGGRGWGGGFGGFAG